MKPKLYLLLLTTLIALAYTSCIKDRNFKLEVFTKPGLPDLSTRTIIHYWNFNTATLLTPTLSSGGASLGYTGGGAYDAVNPGTNLNARGTDAAGGGLRLRNPAGTFTLTMPTTNYKDIIFSFAVQRSNNGPQQNKISYTVDGTHFITDSLETKILKVDTLWQNFYYDFSNIKRVNDNPNFKIRINFAVNDTGTSGNDRYDNIVLDGNIISPPVIPATPAIMHYWNFNTTSPLSALLTPSLTIGSGSITYAGASYDDFTPGSSVNARNGDAAGTALRLRSAYGPFTITAPTTGYKSIKLTMEVQRSNNGATSNVIAYTTDGVNYITTGLAFVTYEPGLDPSYQFITIDFSGITAANNNPNFKVKIDFTGSTAGNNRFDNLVIEGIKI
jgi:hypothetical protein